MYFAFSFYISLWYVIYFEFKKESGYRLKVMILIMKLIVLQIFMIIDVFKFQYILNFVKNV